MDEWLQKWNRTCPLCKSTIQRRKTGRTAAGIANRSSTADQEHVRLLSHEDGRESEASGRGGGGGEGRDGDTYGATGHLNSPLARPPSELVEEGERGRVEQSVIVTLEVPEEGSGEGRRDQSNLAENEAVVPGKPHAAASPLEEQA